LQIVAQPIVFCRLRLPSTPPAPLRICSKAFPLVADRTLRVQLTEIAPELADAADVLSDQLRAHLQRLAVFLLPHAETLDRRFLAKLKKRKFEPQQFEPKIRTALASLTPGAAARILASGQP